MNWLNVIIKKLGFFTKEDLDNEVKKKEEEVKRSFKDFKILIENFNDIQLNALVYEIIQQSFLKKKRTFLQRWSMRCSNALENIDGKKDNTGNKEPIDYK